MYLGLDCGGSTTRAVVIDRDENIIFERKAGPANWATTPRTSLSENIKAGLKNCPKVDAVCGCFAGLLTQKDRSEAIALLKKVTGCERVDARADYYAALAACPPETTICVIAGTGSMVCSYHEGEVVKTGGGGPLFGDVGSAFGLVRMAISTLISTPYEQNPAMFQNKAGESSAFVREFLKVLKASTIQEAIATVYARNLPAAELAKLAPYVIGDFDNRMRYSKHVILLELTELGLIAHSHLFHFHRVVKRPTIALVGGLWGISPTIVKEFQNVLECSPKKPKFQYVLPTDPPALGAARLAQQLK